MKTPCVYILASKEHGTLYVGVTSDPVKRIWEHKQEFVPGFTRDYCVHNLVYFELHGSMEEAILRERRMKTWRRAWKIDLIEKDNPRWRDLYESLI